MRYLLVIAALAAAMVGAWWLVPEDRRDVVLQRSGEVAEQLPGTSEQDASTTVYRWDDEHGHTHYGQAPPPGVEAEPVEQRSVPVLPSDPDSES